MKKRTKALWVLSILLAAVFPTAAAEPGQGGGPPPPPTIPPYAVVPSPTELEGQIAGQRYLEVILGDAKPEDELPMLVAIHGLGSHPQHFAKIFAGVREPLRLILPQGGTRHKHGYSWFPVLVQKGNLGPMEQGIRAATEKIADLIATLVKARPTRGRPIVTGFSQGGMLTFSLALRRPEVVGIAIPVSGFLPPGLLPERKAEDKAFPPIRALHGFLDPRVHIQWVRNGVSRLQDLGFDVRLHEYPRAGHRLAPTMNQQLFTLIGKALARTEGS